MAYQFNISNIDYVKNASHNDCEADCQDQEELLPRHITEIETEKNLKMQREKYQINEPKGPMQRSAVNSSRESKSQHKQTLPNQHLDPLNEDSDYTRRMIKAAAILQSQGRQSNKYLSKKRQKGIKTQRDSKQSVVAQMRKVSEGSKYFLEKRLKPFIGYVDVKKCQIQERQSKILLSEEHKVESRIQNLRQKEINSQNRIFELKLQQREIKDQIQQLSQQQDKYIAQIQGLRQKKKVISKQIPDLRIEKELLKDQIQKFMGKKQYLLREEKEREERFSKAEKERKERLLILERKYEQSFVNFQNQQRDWKKLIENQKGQLEELHSQCSQKRGQLKILSEKVGRKQGEQTQNFQQRSQSSKKAYWH